MSNRTSSGTSSGTSSKFESRETTTEALQELLRQASVEESRIEGFPVRLFSEALETCKAELTTTRRCEILQRYVKNNGEEELPPELMASACGGRIEQEQACMIPILCKRQIRDFEKFQELLSTKKDLKEDNPKVEAVQRRLVGNIVGCMTRWDHEFSLSGLINTTLRCPNEMAAKKECEVRASLSKEGWSSVETTCSKEIEAEKDCIFRHFCRNSAPVTLPSSSSPSSPSPPSVSSASSSSTSVLSPKNACYHAFMDKAWLIGVPRPSHPEAPSPFSPTHPRPSPSPSSLSSYTR